jgi:hypothetical protein
VRFPLLPPPPPSPRLEREPLLQVLDRRHRLVVVLGQRLQFACRARLLAR